MFVQSVQLNSHTHTHARTRANDRCSNITALDINNGKLRTSVPSRVATAAVEVRRAVVEKYLNK